MSSSDSNDQRQKKDAERILDLVSGAELVQGEDGTPYIEFQQSEGRQLCPTESNEAASVLQEKYFEKYQTFLERKKIDLAISHLSFLARRKPKTKIYTRIAKVNDTVYVDLGNTRREFVRITPDGWSVEHSPPIKFIRPTGMAELPPPTRGGTIQCLEPLLNFEGSEDFHLFLSYILGALVPSKEFAILILQGPQGSAKSTTSELVKELIDPGKPVLRSFPRTEQEIFIAAKNSHLIAFDNLSGLSATASDSICKIATGCGISSRKLYTNYEEVFVELSRPMIINGIDCLSSRPDLADRAVVIHLPKVSEARRMLSSTFWSQFFNLRPSILGCLYDAVSKALRDRASLNLAEKPRMADFAVTACAGLQAFGYAAESTISVLLRNRKDVAQDSVEQSVLGQAIREFSVDHLYWRGTSSELFAKLFIQISDGERRNAFLLRSPSYLSRELNRLAPALRLEGIEVDSVRTSKRREIVIARKDASPLSQMSLFSQRREPPMTQVTEMTGQSERKEVDRDLI